MIESHLYAVVMAGGQGTRFWPESYSKRPKQYLSLVGKDSLLTTTLNRFDSLVSKDKRYVVTVKEQEGLASECSNGAIAEDGLVFEPSGRNTAPCILLAMAHLLAKGASENDVMAIVPSDHVILNEKGFQESLRRASQAAVKQSKIVTIGIKPNFSHTGYGYIHRGSEASENTFCVEAFKEKPNKEVATEYLKTGEYLWNAGMFVSTIKTLVEEFSKHAPDIFTHFSELKESIGDFAKTSEVYGKIPAESIDYAIMEKSSEVLVTPADFDWNDLGSWDALESVVEKKENNVIIGERDFYFQNSKNNIVFAPKKFVGLVNVNDMIVISNDNVTVVLPKSDSQKVKDIVTAIKEKKDLQDLI
ncbi:mannose-1-phosphate guanylyltransferase [Bacteriovoracaceae bacterium]|nr:mannose-1-phosphate guanylyltransferase [Bacteriovoracaceae bacterium]